MRIPPDIPRRNPGQPHVVRSEVDPVDGDQNGAAKNGEDDKNVAAHPGESHEESSVQADQVDKILLRGRPQREDPRKDAIPQGRRRVFLIGVLEFRRIYNAIVRPKEGEADGDAGGDTEGGAQRSKNRVLFQLERVSRRMRWGLASRGMAENTPGRRRGRIVVLIGLRRDSFRPPSRGDAVVRPFWMGFRI